MSDKRRGLGKGLSALLPREEPKEGVRSLPLAQLVPNRYQPRSHFDDDGLEELTASIRAQGVIQPIVVRAIEDYAGRVSSACRSGVNDAKPRSYSR